MALYDIIDEITARQVTKTETGDNRMTGVTIGLVAKNYDSFENPFEVFQLRQR